MFRFVRPVQSQNNPSTFRRLFAALFALLFIFLPLAALAQTAYVDEHGNHLHSPVTATALAGGGAATLTVGWYVTDCTANNPIQYTDTLTISGNVNLILADGCGMTVASASQNAAINVATGNSLTIYAQSIAPFMGALTATGDNYSAGIGSSLNVGSRFAGTINIYGGTVTAHGGDAGAGIGGGNAGVSGEINIYGGTVNATGGYGGAGIGGGVTGGPGAVNGGVINISGGTVTAMGDSGGAGIGGGSGAAGDTITISGGTVKATGSSGGAGIGGGAGSDSGSITIGGSAQVTATGGNAPDGVGAGAGIGSGGGDSDTGGVAGSVGAMIIQPAAIHSATGGTSGSGGSYNGADIGSGGGASSGAGTGAFTFDDTGPNHGVYTTDCGSGSSVQYFGTITISGDVTLILADGCSMSVTAASQNAAINVQQGNSLTIDAQVGGTGSLTANGDSYGAGIGGDGFQGGGNITIHGGTVTAHGGDAGAGIGGGNAGVGGTVNITGGTVNATGGFGGAGIGGGVTGGPGAINGGTVNISGGTVTATGDSGGAGIGGGSGAAGDTIIITGGTVTATGGAGFSTVGGGAGIGGGAGSDSGSITIGGSAQVTATGGNAPGGVGAGAGIGSGGGDSDTSGVAGSLGALAIQQAAAVSVTPAGGTSSSGGTYNGAAIGLGGGVGGGAAATMLTVTASAGAGGSISPSGTWSVNQGPMAFTITPNSGFVIASVMDGTNDVTGSLVSGVYTLTNITTDHTIAATFVAASADLAVSMAADNAAPAPGDTVTLTITVTNNGPNGTPSISLTHVWPTSLTGAEYSTDGGLTWASWLGGYNPGGLTSGESKTFLVRFTVSPTAANGSTISSTITVSSGLMTTDPDMSNNTDAVTLLVTAPTVTGVSVSPPTASVVQGGTRQFSAMVAGTGSPAQTVDWTVTGGHTGTSISTSGLLTVSPNETATTLIVRATSTADPGFSGTAAVTVLSSYTPPPPPPPGPTGTYTGQWIQVNGSGVPTENNWGLSILMGFPSDPGYIFVPWFTYDSSGNPSWYVFQGNGKQWSGVDTITMDVVRYHGSPWGTLPYDNSVMGHSTVGTATLTFNSATSATFAYNVEGASRTVNLVPIDGLPMKPSSYTGQWFAPAEDNWGLSVLQGFQSNPDDVFVPWYIYDGSGKASWYVFENHIVGNVVTADVYRYTGPEWGTTWDNGKITNEKVGTAKLTFTSKTAAVFEYDVEGSSRSVDLVKIE